MEIERLDHLVLTVANIETACEFYQGVMGMQVITFSDNRKALIFGQQKINLHQVDLTFEPKAHRPTPGSADLCFITSTSLAEIINHLRICKIAIIEGPVRRSGALGPIESIYFRDPDLNLIEVANYIAQE